MSNFTVSEAVVAIIDSLQDTVPPTSARIPFYPLI